MSDPALARSVLRMGLTDAHNSYKSSLSHPVTNVQFRACLSWSLCNLADALKASASLGHRIADKEWWIPELLNEGDLTSCVVAARNVVCHVGSPLQQTADGSYWRWNSMFAAEPHACGTVGVGLRILDPLKWTMDDTLYLDFGQVQFYPTVIVPAALERLKSVAQELKIF